MVTLEQEADAALFEGKIKGIVLAFYENERPLQGLAGQFDWRFQGVVSKYIKAGAISGKEGECVYVPAEKNGKTYHLILAGAGPLSANGKRGAIPQKTWSAVKKNLTSLKLEQIGISRLDFTHGDESLFTKNLKGLPLWIVP